MTCRYPLACTALALLLALAGGCAGTPIGGPQAPQDDPAAGLLVLESGRAVHVYPAELRFTGRAEYRWPDGRSYVGAWQDGAPQGEGTETRPDGERYTGQWLQGVRQGLGELRDTSGGLYQGEFDAGLRVGKGMLSSADGTYYGDWLADREHGFGELAGAYGSHYSGEWREGRRAGQGSYSGADGSSYQGEWLDDLPHGFGIFSFPDGSVYAGQWLAGRQHGTGRLLATSGVTYEGLWKDAQRSGYGIEQRPDGSQYAGEWQADKRHGQGRETWADGSFHDGLWELNQPLGPGQRRYASGIDIQGVWNGDSVSSGLLNLPSGREYAGPLFRNHGASANPLLQRWLEAAGADDDAHAQLLAATLYLDFTEPAPDPTQARAWLEPAAAAGVPEAAFRLGVLLLDTLHANAHRSTDTPVSADSEHHASNNQRVLALRWLGRAAAAEHAEARRVLGDLYSADEFVPADAGRAIEEYTHALHAGSPLAAERLARLLVTTPDPSQRDPARAIAVLEWVAHHTGYWQHFATLAMAYAASGDPRAATLAQERAIAAATPAPGAVLVAPQPRAGTPGRATSLLVNPTPLAPDLDALQAQLADYRRMEEGREP